MFEKSARSHSPLFISSWDISKAFNSQSKNVLRFSWTRLGVPPDIANFLVSLDDSGHTLVRTVESKKIWKKQRYKGLGKITYYIDAVRGAGQGDVGSPFNWDAAYDILLCALDTTNQDNFHILRSSVYLMKGHDIAYADALLSGMASLQGLQLKADIVSAFSKAFGLAIAHTKLRTFIMIHLPDGTIQRSAPLIIHTTGHLNLSRWRLKEFLKHWVKNMTSLVVNYTTLNLRNLGFGRSDLATYWKKRKEIQ